MLQVLADWVIQDGLRAVGWAVLRVLTLGRYRGFREQDILVEGPIGLAAIAGLCFLAYRWW